MTPLRKEKLQSDQDANPTAEDPNSQSPSMRRRLTLMVARKRACEAYAHGPAILKFIKVKWSV